jgi:hypothetical protein
MNKFIPILGYSSITLGLISLFLIILSLTSQLQFDPAADLKTTVDSIYSAVGIYSTLYNFTFIVCAFWATLRQLEIAQNNNDHTLAQLKFVQDDIVDKRNRDITNDTLKECNFYHRDLQISFKEFIETNIVNGMPLDWSELKTLTNDSLRENYPTLYDRISNIESEKKGKILITFYQLEAFCLLFTHGNLDKKLGKEIIGDTFLKQIGFLLGTLSYFREDTNTVFGRNTIKLYNEWKAEK